MSKQAPTILALDFDGVLCNGLVEYFQTAWRTYCEIWKPSYATPPEHLAPIFYRLRPVIETGWEMPVLIQALLKGISEEQILEQWQAIAKQILTQENRDAKDIAYRLDRNRDEWIATDIDKWLSLHSFYPGVVEKLAVAIASPTKIAIVTTKEGRFVQKLLQQQGISLPQTSIIGKESKRPKHETLRQLLAVGGEETNIWFVEDRLKTLLSVREQPDLNGVALFLADWGYNTQKERRSVDKNLPIRILSLSQFGQDFSAWL